jgi:hypothetical protein
MIIETLNAIGAKIHAAVTSRIKDDYRYIRGDVFLTVRNATTGEVEQTWEKRNLIVSDASILVARLMKDPLEPPQGIFALAVGSGDTGWDPMNPPAATVTQRALYAEITRKVFAETVFVDSLGTPVSYPTNVVDFRTVYTESEAVGPLVEMGLIGGNISTNLSTKNPVSPPNGTYDPTVDLTTRETLVNYLTFPVINKPATSTLELTWRLTF